MPQISKIKYSDILAENRLDAEFHRSIFFNPKLKYSKIGDILLFSQYGISIDMNENKIGTKIYRMNEIDNMFCSSEVGKYADITQEEIKKFKLQDGDVLFNRTNSFVFVGRTGIFKEFSNEDFVFASYLIRIRPDTKLILPEYLTTFLNTKYGIFDVKRRARISINQSNVNAEELKKVKIPLIDMNIQERIKNNFILSNKKQTQSKQLYQEAEQLLLQELGLLEYIPQHQLTFSTTKKEIDHSHRYDAEYFQPKYYDIIEKIENYQGGWDIVENVFKFNNTNFFPKKEDFYTYIALSNVGNDGTISIPEKQSGELLPTRARRKVKEGDLILSSISGSLETSAIIQKEHDGFIVSNGFYVFRSTVINSETLLILFKSKIMIEILNRISKGAILGGYDLTAFGKIKIPLIKPEIQSKIAQKIQESYQLRKESKQLLEDAKRMVEEEIEKA